MKFKKFGSKYVVRIEKGEEIVTVLEKFCNDNHIKLASLTGVGAVNKATVGVFEADTRAYNKKEITGDHEITSLIGNVSELDGKACLHIHVNLADVNCNVVGGHLNSAYVSVTCEIVFDVIDGIIDKKYNEEIGVNLLNI